MLSAARSPISAATITFLGLLIPLVALLATGTMEPIELMRVGEQSKAAPLVASRFGADVLTEGDAGYDGVFYWVMADTLPDLDAAEPHLDDAPYRMQRILPSALAALTGGGAAAAVALSLLAILGTTLCVYAVADLAERHGRAPELGLLAVLPLVYALGYSTTEPLAFGLAFLGLCAADRERHGTAVALITLGALSRESAAVFGLGVGLGLLLEMARRRRPWRLWLLAAYLVPLMTTTAWAWWLRQRLEPGHVINRIVPFGLLDASAGGLILGLTALALGVLGAWTWRDAPMVWGTSLGFAAGSLLYYGPFFMLRSLPRASAPAIALGLAGLVSAVVGRHSHSSPAGAAAASAP